MQNKTKIAKNTNWQTAFQFIKWLVPFLIALILYKKFYKNNNLTFDTFKVYFLGLNWYWYPFLICTAFLNWSLEIMKWRFLVSKLEKHSVKKGIKAVLSGVAVSQLLPYRTGEYLGRLAFVGESNRIQAGILSVAGSFSQFMITMVLGFIAFLVIKPIEVPVYFTVSSLLFLFALIIGYFFIPQLKQFKSFKWVSTLSAALALLKNYDLLKLIGFSFLRYLCFLVPYVLLASHYRLGFEHSLLYYAAAVACIYFLQTISPNFILTDLAVRITVSSLVFSGTIDRINGLDHLPAMIIYVFNVALPMCLGAVILLLLKLKR